MRGYLVKVVKAPDGPAPLKIREKWVGVILPAVKSLFEAERNFLTEERIPAREGSFAVPVSLAIQCLREFGEGEAADCGLQQIALIRRSRASSSARTRWR